MRQSQEIRTAILDNKLTLSQARLLETLILEDIEDNAREDQLLNICGR